MISDARGSHVSPGIYTDERDVTYSVKSLGITSLGLVGETLYGPAFENVEIESWSEFIDYFGGTSTEKYKNGNPKYELPFIAKSYLEESKRLNVVRVLGLSGYHAGPTWTIKQEDRPVLVLRSKMVYGENTDNECGIPDTSIATAIIKGIDMAEYTEKVYDSNCVPTSGNGQTNKDNNHFAIEVEFIDENKDKIVYNLSLNPTDSNYVYNILSNNPQNSNAPIYIDALYEGSFNKEEKLDEEIIYSNNFENYFEGYRAAQTPWIVSDAIVSESGCTARKLFKFITISDGDIANYQVKVSIQNIKPDEGTFDVVVRDFYDTDANPIILEKFNKCNLVDGDVNYIAYKIGTADGGYVSKSKYIVVEMAEGEDLKNAIPAGFMGYPIPDYKCNNKVKVKYYDELNSNIKTKRQYFGMSNINGIEYDLLSYKGVDTYATDDYLTNGFHMDAAVSKVADELSATTTITIDGKTYDFSTVSYKKIGNETMIPRLTNIAAINKTIYKDINARKFTVCFYGGFDGWDINREERTNGDAYKATKLNVDVENGPFRKVDENDDLNNYLNLPTTAITSDYYAYLAGYRVFANPQDIDINLFATPGIDWYNNTLLTEEVIEMIEESEDGRGGDALYIMASPLYIGASELAYEFDNLDINSSYACTYAPNVMYYDNSNKKYINLSVTKDVVRNMAATDNNSYPWFAPAGVERGNVECVKAEYKTTINEEDELYENNINPVKTFAKDGVKVWGNKTAYKVDSPLNRINVRRLMIRVKKLITSAAKNLIFEQYDDNLEMQFRSIVEPILANIKSNRGISDYKLITEVTPEAKDQHILPAKILIKPTPALEYISISFVVYPESISFEE